MLKNNMGRILISQKNFNTTVFVNDRDLKVGDTVTLEIKRQYHEEISYSVNGGTPVSLQVFDHNHEPKWVIDTLTFTVHSSGRLYISFDDPWNSVSRHPEDGQGYLIVKKDDQVLENVNTGYIPNSPADQPNMVYAPEMEKYTTEDGVEKERVKVFDKITLNSGNSWQSTSKTLELYDENGNQYQYFIIEEHGADGTMHGIGTNADGTIMTANTPDSPLQVTNVVPSTSIAIQKTDKENEPLPGAEFELWWLKDNCWTKITDIKDFDETTVTASVGNLFDGRYRLKETKAPDGYLILNQNIYFNIYNQEVILADENGGKTDETIYNNMINIDGTMLIVQNEPGKPLPSTGGGGTTAFYLAGGLITLLALALLIAKRRAD